jgi:transposase
MRQIKDKKAYRHRLVFHAMTHGNKAAARTFNTTVKTVRKWVRRWNGKLESLAGLSTAPKNPRLQVTPAQRREAVRLKKKFRPFGAARLKRDWGLSLSDKALRKIWREEGLGKKRRRKHKTKQDLRAVKALWRLFEQTCVDTKDLDDIPEMYLQIKRLGLPLIQYTAREVVSGAQFLAYAHQRTVNNSALFARLLTAHLLHHGVELADCRFQTDNGSEFIGSWQAREDSAFTKAVEEVAGLEHHTIPPAAHTWQSDVETAHNLIEGEFYEVEQFASTADFLRKAFTYSVWFNTVRKNSYKANRSPWDIIHERIPAITEGVCAFPPVILDDLLYDIEQERVISDGEAQEGYDLIPQASRPGWLC